MHITEAFTTSQLQAHNKLSYTNLTLIINLHEPYLLILLLVKAQNSKENKQKKGKRTNERQNQGRGHVVTITIKYITHLSPLRVWVPITANNSNSSGCPIGREE